MDWVGWASFGLIATGVLTAVMIGAQLVGLTRLDLAFMLGTIVVADPDRARVAGFFIHLVNGQLFALVYAAAFAAVGRATWWGGAILGVVHGAVALLVLVPLLPGVHPAHGVGAGWAVHRPGARAPRPTRPQLRPRDAVGHDAGARRLRRRLGSVARSELSIADGERRLDERSVGEGLRVVAELGAGRRVDLLGEAVRRGPASSSSWSKFSVASSIAPLTASAWTSQKEHGRNAPSTPPSPSEPGG